MEKEIMSDPSSAWPPVNRYLSCSAYRGNVQGIHTFLNKGVKIEEDANGRTPLLWAISGGREDTMRLLLQKGANLHRKTYDGDNALICAVWGGNPRIVKRLMDAGFDIHETGSQGKSALDWAEELGKTAVLQVLNEPVAARKRELAASHARAAALQKRFKARAGGKPIIGPGP